MRRTPLAIALALFAAGCASKVVPIHAQLITGSCVSPGPLDGVTYLRFRVTGPGMSEVDQTAPVNARTEALPAIPAGQGRVLEVRGYDADPSAGGNVLSVGRSLPFDVPDVVPPKGSAETTVRVRLRRVNTFTPPSLASSPGTCLDMSTPRAGHTATLLPDGRVYIAGGYQVDGAGQTRTLASAALFDPLEGSFTVAADLGVTDANDVFTPTPRAFHTATLLPTGQVLLAGGEVEGTPPAVLGSALVFDPRSNGYGALPLVAERAHQMAAREAHGKVLLIGGVNGSGALVSTAEWYDPSTGTSSAVSGTFPRIGAVLAPFGDGSSLALVGGSDGTRLMTEIRLFQFDGTTFTSTSAGVSLREGRMDFAFAPFQDQGGVLVLGGYGSTGKIPSNAVASSELLSGNPLQRSDGPSITARGGLCAAGLSGGQVLVAGGRTVDDSGNVQSTDIVELVTTSRGGNATVIGMPPLDPPRSLQTCTELADGSVLVLGGVTDDGTVLDDAAIFMPAPTD